VAIRIDRSGLEMRDETQEEKMRIGAHIRLTIDIPSIHKKGDVGIIRGLYYASPNVPRSWEVYFQSDDSTHYIYDDEMEEAGCSKQASPT
jgi:hypothetical protein